jgi:ATP-dependent DNA helicase DinG
VRLEDRGIWVYAQGKDASRSSLTEAFQKSDRAVLLGAASFWEGVDFPGAELEILVMVRLPFPVPRDPFVEAYAERLREEGHDPFDAYMLPEAILRFRQGFGRLIRRRGDRGVFVILDPRVLRRAYGTRFTETLGAGVRPVDSWEALIEESERWFAGDVKAPNEEEGQ